MSKQKNFIILIFIFGLAILSTGLYSSYYLLYFADIPRIRAFNAIFVISLSIILISIHFFLRFIKWHHILRTCETYISIKTSLYGYFAGLSLVFIPLIIGEAFLRSFIISRKDRYNLNRIFNIIIIDRSFDIFAILFLGMIFLSSTPVRIVSGIIFISILLSPHMRILFIKLNTVVIGLIFRIFKIARIHIDRDIIEILKKKYQIKTMLLSILIWSIPPIILYLFILLLVRMNIYSSFRIFIGSTYTQMLFLSAGGIISSGRYIIDSLLEAGLNNNQAIMITFMFRTMTLGFSILLGIISVFLLNKYLFRKDTEEHFENIADEYDAQLSTHCIDIVTERKMKRMLDHLKGKELFKGLDIGCGQGYYLKHFNDEGFCVFGIERSKNQIYNAMKRTEGINLVSSGSLPSLPFLSNSFDFVYIINVLHHLPDKETQDKAIKELLRITRKGGLVFINEINTQNIIFHIYMSYIFPILNNIDEGTEQWIKPDYIKDEFKNFHEDTCYFTFLPEWTPGPLWKLFEPLERYLESSFLKRYSAHYISILKKQL